MKSPREKSNNNIDIDREMLLKSPNQMRQSNVSNQQRRVGNNRSAPRQRPGEGGIVGNMGWAANAYNRVFAGLMGSKESSS